MKLNADQMAIINTLLYARNPSLYDSSGGNPQVAGQERTLGDIVNALDSNSNKEDFFTVHEWDIVKKAVQSDDTLKAVVIKSSYYDADTGDAGCVLASGKDAIVAFKGTGIGEWKDNAAAGSTMKNTSSSDPTISTQQQKAIDFVNRQDFSNYDSVMATGHSKGGNKAKIVTLMTDKIDECVSFDGQGFSDEFMASHKAEIQAKQSKITNHNADGDYVNILLNDVGKTYWHEGQRVDGNPLKYHSPTALLQEDGTMASGEQSAITKAFDKSLNAMLRSIPQNKKADVLRLTGDIMDALMGRGSDHKLWNMRKILADPRNFDELAIIFAYLPITMLEQIPGLDWIIHKLQDFGVLPRTTPGDDIQYETPEPIDSREMGSDTDMIFVDYSGVEALARQLQQAAEQYNNACQSVRVAAINLIDQWEGEGCKAFAADQQRMLQWCQALGQSAFNIADHMIITLQKYREMENNLRQIMI